MRQAWRLKGNLSLANLGEKKLLLEFNLKGEAWWVLQKGERKFSFFRIDLRRWKSDEGCSPISKTSQVWVRLFGLPVFVWEEKNLKKFYRRRQLYLGFFRASLGLPPCSCGWKEIFASVDHQDGGEELEDPAMVGTSTCLLYHAGKGSSVFQQGQAKG